MSEKWPQSQDGALLERYDIKLYVSESLSCIYLTCVCKPSVLIIVDILRPSLAGTERTTLMPAQSSWVDGENRQRYSEPRK